MTPEIFYGTYQENRGQLVRVGGLEPHLTFEPAAVVNLNYASPELLQAAGLSQPAIQTIEQIRRQRPLEPGDPGVAELTQLGSAVRVGLGGTTTAYTLRATARLANGRTTRTVAAVARYGISPQFPLEITRWSGAVE
jgi:hypothetical protein